MKYLLIIWSFLLLISCEKMLPSQKIIEVVSWGDMGETIKEGDTVQILITQEYSRNDIIFFLQVEVETDSLILIPSRILGLPGETVMMRNGVIYINDQEYVDPPEVNRPYLLHLGLLGSSFFEETNFEQSDFSPKDFFELSLTKTELELVDYRWKNVNEIPGLETLHSSEGIVGRTSKNNWSRYNWGPIKIPNVGDKVVLDDRNNGLYDALFFEKKKKNLVEIECYFLISDDRGSEFDSRFIGLIPENAVIGKVVH